MIRTLHLVHNSEWQKGLERRYMRTDLMCTQTPPASQCAAEYPIYCPTIVCSALSSIEAKCLGPLNTTLDTMDGQREAGSWQKWDADTHILTINMNTHTYVVCKWTYSTHTRMYSIIHIHTFIGINTHLLKGTKLAQQQGQNCIQAPMGLEGIYTHKHTSNTKTHTHTHAQKQGLASPRQRVEKQRLATVRGSHKRQTQERGWQKMLLMWGENDRENDIISIEREPPGGTVFFLYVSVAQTVSERKQWCQVSSIMKDWKVVLSRHVSDCPVW